MAGRARRVMATRKPGVLPEEAGERLDQDESTSYPPETVVPKTSTTMKLPESAIYAKEFIPTAPFATEPSPNGLSNATGRDPPKLEEISRSTNRKLPTRPKDEDEKIAIDGFVETMHKLLHRPENFVALVSGLVETMNRWLIETKTMEFLACLLFEEAVCNPEFRFTGAKMFEYIDQRLNVEGHPDYKLRPFLLTRCNTEHDKFSHAEYQQMYRARWFGMALFLGEMYRFVKVRGEPYSVLGQGVLEHLHFLIADGNEDAIVTCLALYKLVGPMLDEKGGRDFLTDVTTKLSTCLRANESNFSERLLRIGERTIQLRESGWDLGDVTAAAAADPFFNDVYSDFYTEDDLSDDVNFSDEIVDDVYFDGEMDEEAMAAFEAFLSGQKS